MTIQHYNLTIDTHILFYKVEIDEICIVYLEEEVLHTTIISHDDNDDDGDGDGDASWAETEKSQKSNSCNVDKKRVWFVIYHLLMLQN